MMRFGPAEVFGELRAFHNIDTEKIRAEGLKTVSATVKATERCLLFSIKQPTDILVLQQSYVAMQEHKVNFLRSIPHYKYCSEDSLQKLACNMRRKFYRPKSVVVVEG